MCIELTKKQGDVKVHVLVDAMETFENECEGSTGAKITLKSGRVLCVVECKDTIHELIHGAHEAKAAKVAKKKD